MVIQNTGQPTTQAAAGQYQRAVGVFKTRAEAERVIHDMDEAGLNMERVSVVARDADEVSGIETGVKEEEVGNHADDGAATGAITGGAIGGVGGLLVGLGALAIPGIGPILLAGAEATAIATTLAGGAIGAAAGGLVGALIGLGIPEERARVYNDRVASGEYLVMVNSVATDIASAEAIMKRHNVEEFEIYGSTGSALDNADNLKLYEERLKVNKDRVRTGQVSVGKRVISDTAEVAVPVEKERVVIERTTPTATTATPTADAFQSGEVARVEVYEESADIRKEAVVAEEVNVRKETTQETVTAEETLRREELDVKSNDGTVIRES
ncbi:YsnF/AvaK domain-containing protein [cf. Phormidesmis sp. LEGE 11477]|uniref:YsnF/AvaK domain-containing protein n=1 Tax=cf. Phormidesmis sp. LEGE 11477 TaxID=1828680 RepID=UPI001881FB60|nr:YsnF/AvaK domain-containing protein [cf. Phormidesmis sp. LEGE 11477]MBE9064557.1 YsnF/AvaK domain-containing protein [cf. Phormidesmis sp. LEGE 11477]